MDGKKEQFQAYTDDVGEKIAAFTKQSEEKFLQNLLHNAPEKDIEEYFKEFPEAKQYWNK